MDASRITLIIAAFLIGGISKGAVGIGQMTVTLAILSNVLGLRELIPLLVIPALVGMAIGTWVRDRVSQTVFRTCIFSGLLFIGLNLIRKSVL